MGMKIRTLISILEPQLQTREVPHDTIRRVDENQKCPPMYTITDIMKPKHHYRTCYQLTKGVKSGNISKWLASEQVL